MAATGQLGLAAAGQIRLAFVMWGFCGAVASAPSAARHACQELGAHGWRDEVDRVDIGGPLSDWVTVPGRGGTGVARASPDGGSCERMTSAQMRRSKLLVRGRPLKQEASDQG